MQLLCLGLNHTTAPVSVRESVAFGPDETESGILTLRERLASPECGGLAEAMILSTCNRTEFYCAVADARLAAAALCRVVEDLKGLSAPQFEPHVYTYVQTEAARHLYRVVSGIDSMVLGETQIVGQFKKAVAAARRAGGLGLFLNHLFQEAFTVTKTVRSSTAIGSSSVSYAAAAVRLSERLFGDLSNENVLFVGAGQMIEVCMAHFCAQPLKSVTVANRTLERGEALASRFHARAIRLQDLPELIANYDIIVSCTASALPIIGLGMMERAIRARRHRPVCLVDLAVPRDVEPEVAKLDDVYVYSMDELGAVVQSGRASRQAAVSQAEELISRQVSELEKWLAMRAAVPAIASLRARAESVRREELALARRRLQGGGDPLEVLEFFSEQLTHKLIHDPTILLRDGKDLTEAEREHVTRILGEFYRPRQVP